MVTLGVSKRQCCECVVWRVCVSVCVSVCVLSGCATGFSHGAMSSSCRDLKPGHVGAQHTHQPHTHAAFTLHPSRAEYLPHQTLTVTLRSARPFMGFMLQARSVQGDRVLGDHMLGDRVLGDRVLGGRVLGEFLWPPPGTQRMGCTREGDTLTHSDKQLKRNMSFTWRAPAQPSGDVRFYITVVQSYFIYWSRIQSAVVHDGTRSLLGMINSTAAMTSNSQNKLQTTSLYSPTVSSVTDRPKAQAFTTPATATLPSTSTFGTWDHRHTTRFSHTMSQELNTTRYTSPHITHLTAGEPINTQSSPSFTSDIQTTVNTNLNVIERFTKPGHPFGTQATKPTPTREKYSSAQPTLGVAPESPTGSPSTGYTLSKQTYTRHPNTPARLLTHTLFDNKFSPTTKTQALSRSDTSPSHSVSPVLDPSPAPLLSLPDPLTPPIASPSPSPPPPPPPPPPAYRHPNQSAVPPVPPAAPGISGRPATEGGRPRDGDGDRVPRHRASARELGLLLGCSAGLGVLLTLALRCLQRRCCRKRSEVCLSERSRRWEERGEHHGVIHVQEYGGDDDGRGGGGELVQVRRIRQNSLLLLQTEYNLITPPGN
ncbi:hypothetical protein ACEWY4_024881 [Coilia grayii]|uniref:Reelin domain-containing protein n=1 Tax=Coilia grayii TaxID=363190 RepID=A0ABD1IWD2_9TELE